MDERVKVGRVVKAHGIKGGVIARQTSDGSDVLLHVTQVTLAQAGRLTTHPVVSSQLQSKQILLYLKGLTDRNAAEALVGADVFIGADELPPPEDGAFYRSELVGMAMVRPDGTPIGPVVDLESSPMQEWLVVEVAGRNCLVPFTEPLVKVDRQARRVVCDAPEGLFDGD